MPNQYQLLRHAVTLADQLEAAGCPEAAWVRRTPTTTVMFDWPPSPLLVQVNAPGEVIAFLAKSEWRFRVGDPLPPELIAAIKATEGA